MANCIWIATNSNDWGATANWSGGAVPTDGDDVIFQNSSVDVNGSLDQNAVALNSLTIWDTYTGKIGTVPAFGVAGTPLKIGATTITIGRTQTGSAKGAGSPWINLDTDGDANTVTVLNTCANSAVYGLPPVNLIGNSSSNVWNIRRGKVGIAIAYAANAATIGTLNIGEYGAPVNACEVTCGTGLTVTTIKKQSGRLLLQSAATTITHDAGEMTTEGSGAVTTYNLNGGLLVSNSTGTITNLNLNGDSRADFTQSYAARTVTNTNGRGGSYDYDASVITFTNPPSGKFGSKGGSR